MTKNAWSTIVQSLSLFIITFLLLFKYGIEGAVLAIYQDEGSTGTPKAVKSNIEKLEEVLEQAKKYNVQLISFPELYLTGYALNPNLVKQLAEKINGSSIRKVSEIANKNDMAIIFPYPERDFSSR